MLIQAGSQAATSVSHHQKLKTTKVGGAHATKIDEGRRSPDSKIPIWDTPTVQHGPHSPSPRLWQQNWPAKHIGRFRRI